MDRLIIIAFLSITLNANAFESFLTKAAKKNNVLNEINILRSKKEITKTQSINDRIVLGNIQLSFEEGLAECIQKEECLSGRISINTPLPSTPLRADKNNISEVSGTDNKKINDILLARKKALLEFADKNSSNLILISYKKDGNKAINYNKYKEIISNSKNIVDCQGCYEFFNEKTSGATYTVITKKSKKITLIVSNTQLLEKNNSQQIKVTYKT